MKTTLYLIRHAQCSPAAHIHYSQWPLSETGKNQAQQLAPLLKDLAIEKMFSSPFDRCLLTVQHFKSQHDLEVKVVDDLRERLIEEGFSHMETSHIWQRSWEDLNFRVHEGSETSIEAQGRFVNAVSHIAANHGGQTIGISSHGNVIALFFNYLDSQYKRQHAEKIRNPDVFRIEFENGTFMWDSTFSLPGLNEIATHHSATKIQSIGN